MGYLIAHFTAVLAYTWPTETKGRFYNYSFVYIYPFFHQNWTLFVPPPKENFNLFVKYRTSKKQQDWKDLFFEIDAKHQNNRLAGNEAILLSLSNALRYYSNIPRKNFVYKDRLDDIELTILKRIIIGYINIQEKEFPQDLDIIIHIKGENVKPCSIGYCK